MGRCNLLQTCCKPAAKAENGCCRSAAKALQTRCKDAALKRKNQRKARARSHVLALPRARARSIFRANLIEGVVS